MFHSRTQHTDKHVGTFDLAESYLATDSNCPKTSHEKFSNLTDDGVIQFRPNKKNGDDESGVCSPPLWSKSPPRNPQESHKKMKNSPPSLRVQAIVRGQVELMEMVKTMPESLYELSLKDLVDHPKIGDQVQADQENGSYIKRKATSSNIKKQGSIRKQGSLKKVEKKMVRAVSNINGENNNSNSNSNNKGLFLKMVFPMPFGGNKKKVAKSKSKSKAKTKENPYAKVCNKSDHGKIVNDQKEWWRRRHSVVSDDSESGGLSSSNGGSGSSGSSGSSQSNQSCRKKSGLLRGCSPFYSSKNKTVE